MKRANTLKKKREFTYGVRKTAAQWSALTFP